jgi:hypothetical protein
MEQDVSQGTSVSVMPSHFIDGCMCFVCGLLQDVIACRQEASNVVPWWLWRRRWR